jgi:hypothetical protein
MIRGMISRNTVSTKNSKGGFKMKLVRWTPMHNIVSSFARDLDRNFNDDWFRFPTNRTWDRSWSPVVDVEERENEIVLNAELPGMKKSDIEITIEENHLTLQFQERAILWQVREVLPPADLRCGGRGAGILQEWYPSGNSA